MALPGMIAIDSLSDGQKACLRLVLQHKQTKEIARELGIAPDTVKQRIKIAMRTLGAETRVQAALLLEAHEKGGYPRGVYPPPGVATTPPAPPQTGSTDEPDAVQDALPVSNLTETHDDLTLRDMTTGFVSRTVLGRPDRAGGGAGNRLPALQRILLILVIAMGAILSVTGLVAAVRELAALGH